MTPSFCDRFGQTVSEGNLVAYGTRVGNVGETRVARVTSVRWVEKMDGGYHEVKVRALKQRYPKDDTLSFELGRESSPNHSNLVRIVLPEAEWVHRV